MGANISKFSCVNELEILYPPKCHFKCRYHKDDEFCNTTPLFTRMKNIERFPVPREKVKWNIQFPEYNPTNFTSDKIKNMDGLAWKDPDMNTSDYQSIKFNAVDLHLNCDRKSYHSTYEMVPFSTENATLVPRNPVGRTGVIGRGHLGRWGPNHAADPIVTQWKRDSEGKVMKHAVSKLPILQFVAIQRKDTKQWAIPGGMRDPGEVITKTLLREFNEEALDRNVKFDKFNRIASNSNFDKQLDKFFKSGVQIYKGYVDDPRNTDNAWMETIACNFHDETSEIVGTFALKGGDDAENATWAELSADIDLFASHSHFLYEVARMQRAHWN